MKYSALFGIVLLAPWPARAQSTPGATQLPTVTVTAADPVITAAGSAEVLTGEDLRARSVGRLEDLQSQSPNLVARSGGSRSINLVLGYRGLVNNAFYGEPAVAFYVDDVAYGSTLTYDTSFLDVQRVELLRGPQFTRWGRQGPAGVIAIYSEPPGDTMGGRAEVSFGNHDEQVYKLRIDGPLGPTLGFSLSGMYSRRDGYLYNELTKIRPDYEEGFTGRFALHWQPTEQLQVKFITSAQAFDDGVQRYTNLDSTPRTIEHDFNGITKSRSDMQSLQFTYTGEDLLFTSISARRYFRMDPGDLDLDFSPLPILPTRVIFDQLVYSQEFRLQPTKAGAVDWFLGAFVSDSDLDVFVDDNVFRADSRLSDTTYALYGEITRKFDSNVDVTLGVRGEAVEKSAERILRQPDGSSTFESRSRTISNFSPKLGVAWRPQEDLLLYGNTSLSYRAGAYSLFNFHPRILSADTERTWANEIGAKARLLDDQLEISVAGFWYEIDDYQIERYMLGGFGVFTADEVTSRGVELEVLWRPLKGLELSAGVGYVNAEFTNHRSAVTGEDLNGRRAPYIPDVTANFAAQYRHDSGIVARAEWLLTGRAFFDEDNQDSTAQGAYGLLNARLGYERENWGVYLYGRNLTDAEYYTIIIPSLMVGMQGEPRSIGVMAALEF